MRRTPIVVVAILATVAFATTRARTSRHPASVHRAAAHDMSPPLASLVPTLVSQFDSLDDDDAIEARGFALAPVYAQAAPPTAPIIAPVITTPAGSAAVEQKSMGTKLPPDLVASFDGLGANFSGPQG